jgi:uncharacterized protein involved in exopolysaccharide biosynthesis
MPLAELNQETNGSRAASGVGSCAEPLTEGHIGDDGEGAIDLEAAAVELWANRRTLLRAAIGAAILAALLALLLPPYYTATASFIPPVSGSSGAAGLAASLSALGASGLLGGGKSSADLYIGILKSRTVADRMIDRFDLMKVYRKKEKSRAQKALAKATSFESDIKNPILSISVTDYDAGRARDMANAYLEELRLASGGLAVTESSQRRLFYEQRLAKEKDDLANAEVALKQSQEATGLIAPAGQMSAEIQAIAEVRAEIAGRQVRLAALRESATDQNADLVALKAEIGDLQAHLQRMESGQDAKRLEGIPASRAPGLELEYIRKAREVKYHEALFEIIARQYEAARLDEANNPPVLQVLDTAILPDARSGPPRTVILAVGLALGLLGSSAWILLQAARRAAQRRATS